MGLRSLVMLVGVVLAVIGACVFVGCTEQVMIWDGDFDLSVDIASEEPPDLVVLMPFGRPDDSDAAFAVQHPSFLAHEYPNRVRLFVESPIIVRVPESGRQSMTTGRELKRFWTRHLVVAARFPDGRWRAVAAEIPDPRESRAIMVGFTVPD